VGVLLLFLHGWEKSCEFILESGFPIYLALTGGTRSGRMAFEKKTRALIGQLTFENIKRNLKWLLSEDTCQNCETYFSDTTHPCPKCGSVPGAPTAARGFTGASSGRAPPGLH
jgi:hypothetical protein